MQAKELGAEPSLFAVWNQFRKKKNKEDGSLTWVSENAELKDTEYRRFFAMARPDANPDTEPFDPEVAMRAGEGSKNGRLWMCDSAVDPRTVRSMREIRRDSSSSSSIQARPTASYRAIDKIRVCSSSLVIHTSFHVFHCNIHDLPMTQRSSSWRRRGDRGSRPRPSLLSSSSS